MKLDTFSAIGNDLKRRVLTVKYEYALPPTVS
jgi:hypothetical protein